MRGEPMNEKCLKGQSKEAQAARLAKGCCPIHGTGMNQATEWFEDFVFVQCSRSDCGIIAKTREFGGPAFEPTEDYGVIAKAREQERERRHRSFIVLPYTVYEDYTGGRITLEELVQVLKRLPVENHALNQ
jgi:hypothetical protein